MTITVCRERKDFWNNYEFVQEERRGADLDDLKKALRAMKKDKGFAMHIDQYTLIWDSITDYENGIVLLRYYEQANSYTEKKCSWENMKKEIMKIFTE